MVDLFVICRVNRNVTAKTPYRSDIDNSGNKEEPPFGIMSNILLWILIGMAIVTVLIMVYILCNRKRLQREMTESEVSFIALAEYKAPTNTC